MAQRSNLRGLDIAAVVLIIIGGLNWGLIGLFGFNLVAAIFGTMSVVSRIIYVLVGAAAIYRMVAWRSAPNRIARCEPMTAPTR